MEYWGFFLRPLSHEEFNQFSPLVLDEECLAHNFLPEDMPQLRWTDDNSNFAGVFRGGPLKGFVFLLDHEDEDSTPRFRSTTSLLESMAEARARADCQRINPEYPRTTPAPTDADDLRLAHLFRDYWREHPHSQPAAFRFLALLPVQATHEALEALDSGNMWIQGAAADLLGRRKFAPSAQRLKEIALSGTQNGRIAALVALGKMGPAGRSHLDELRKLLPDGYAAYCL